ncbi:MAG: DUF1684 domain-containing protein [Bacteroidia bacterium]
MSTNTPQNSMRMAIAVGIGFVVIILFQFFSMKNPNAYQTKMEEFRKQKDAQFQNADDSPLTKEMQADFKGLKYFPIQEHYVAHGKLSPSTTQDTIRLTTSKGEARKYFLIGKLSFELLQTPLSVNAYRAIGDKNTSLFVPFSDLTSGVSSYGGGRYLDLVYTNNDDVEMDFNQAYNPYCVFNATYSCPLPPAENRLNVEIMAGEMNYK